MKTRWLAIALLGFTLFAVSGCASSRNRGYRYGYGGRDGRYSDIQRADRYRVYDQRQRRLERQLERQRIREWRREQRRQERYDRRNRENGRRDRRY
jgi:hypothetical protein